MRKNQEKNDKSENMAQCFLYYSLNQLSLGWTDSLQMFYAGPRGIPSTRVGYGICFTGVEYRAQSQTSLWILESVVMSKSVTIIFLFNARLNDLISLSPFQNCLT